MFVSSPPPPARHIPRAAKCETLGQWRMSHPRPGLLSIDFAVPTPGRTKLAIERWLIRLLALAYVALVVLPALPRYDVAAMLMLVPLGVGLARHFQSPLVQSICMDSDAGMLHVVELVRGEVNSRSIPYSDIFSITYEPATHTSNTSSPACILIDVAQPGRPIHLKRLGLSRHQEMLDWLNSMRWHAAPKRTGAPSVG